MNALSPSGLPTKPVLTLPLVKHLLHAAESHASADRLPVSVAICDDGGHLAGLYRMDAAPPSTVAIASEKARSAAMVRRPGRSVDDLVHSGPLASLTLGSLYGMLHGGSPLRVDGACIGAVGVSGGRPEDDQAIVDVVIAAMATRLSG